MIVILTVSLPSLFSMTIPYPGNDLQNMDYAFAQLPNNSIIQITSTSTFIDDFGNFHVIGEVNNTSFDPQTNILITTILSDTTNNVIVGNHSAFSSIGTLRSGELSSFDILIPNPQIVGKFNFIEFSTSSQLGIEKPANLVLNGSSAFFDNVGNPHITGYIINQGQFPEQLLNFVATFYDNSSLGIVGTQSFGLNVANLTQNQNAPFDITITDNKTKSQAAFYSLNVDSGQSSMSPPFNPKFTFGNSGETTTEQFVTGGLFAPLPPAVPLINDNQGFNDNDNSGSSDSGNGGDLDCEDIDERNFPVGSNDPNDFDRDNDGIGCEADDLNNNGTSNSDLDCEDIDERNFPVGSNDTNNFDADRDGIGCETSEGNGNQTNNDDDEQQVEPQTQQTTDPRNDPKYDSIDWQDDDPDKNLTIEEMDEILEEQQNEDQEQSSDDEQQEQDTTSNDSNDDGESNGDNESEENGEEQEDNGEESDNESDSDNN